MLIDISNAKIEYCDTLHLRHLTGLVLKPRHDRHFEQEVYLIAHMHTLCSPITCALRYTCVQKKPCVSQKAQTGIMTFFSNFCTSTSQYYKGVCCRPQTYGPWSIMCRLAASRNISWRVFSVMRRWLLWDINRLSVYWGSHQCYSEVTSCETRIRWQLKEYVGLFYLACTWL